MVAEPTRPLVGLFFGEVPFRRQPVGFRFDLRSFSVVGLESMGDFVCNGVLGHTVIAERDYPVSLSCLFAPMLSRS